MRFGIFDQRQGVDSAFHPVHSRAQHRSHQQQDTDLLRRGSKVPRAARAEWGCGLSCVSPLTPSRSSAIGVAAIRQQAGAVEQKLPGGSRAAFDRGTHIQRRALHEVPIVLADDLRPGARCPLRRAVWRRIHRRRRKTCPLSARTRACAAAARPAGHRDSSRGGPPPARKAQRVASSPSTAPVTSSQNRRSPRRASGRAWRSVSKSPPSHSPPALSQNSSAIRIAGRADSLRPGRAMNVKGLEAEVAFAGVPPQGEGYGLHQAGAAAVVLADQDRGAVKREARGADARGSSRLARCGEASLLLNRQSRYRALAKPGRPRSPWGPVRSFTTASSRGTNSSLGGFTATMTPSMPCCSAYTAPAPKPSPRMRSCALGDPPRSRCPRTVARDSLPVNCCSSSATRSPMPPSRLHSPGLAALYGDIAAFGLGAFGHDDNGVLALRRW